MVGLVMIFDRGAYSFAAHDPGFFQTDTRINEYIYYGFVTITTLGYGDLVPLTPPARSVSMLSSVCGQLYLTIIIALLVGKYANAKNEADPGNTV